MHRSTLLYNRRHVSDSGIPCSCLTSYSLHYLISHRFAVNIIRDKFLSTILMTLPFQGHRREDNNSNDERDRNHSQQWTQCCNNPAVVILSWLLVTSHSRICKNTAVWRFGDVLRWCHRSGRQLKLRSRFSNFRQSLVTVTLNAVVSIIMILNDNDFTEYSCVPFN